MQSLERESGDGRGGRASLGPGESLLVGVSSPGRWEAVREAEHCHYVHKGPWSQRPERQAWRPEGLGRAGAVGQENGALSPPERDGKNGSMRGTFGEESRARPMAV